MQSGLWNRWLLERNDYSFNILQKQTMPSTPQPELDLRWFFPLFIGGWLLILFLLSVLGGWHALSKRYKSSSNFSGKLFRFVSGSLGNKIFPVSYSSCLSVSIGSDGIGLSVLPLFRFFHPKLLLPWSSVSDCKQEKFWFRTCTTISLSESNVPIRLFGRAGQEISNYCRYRAEK